MMCRFVLNKAPMLLESVQIWIASCHRSVVGKMVTKIEKTINKGIFCPFDGHLKFVVG